MKLPVHVQARRSSYFIRKSARSGQTKKWRRGSCERGKKEEIADMLEEDVSTIENIMSELQE